MSDCIFCKIADGEIPSDTVYETETVKVFKDINPVAPVHLIIIPKVHIENLNDVDSDNRELVADCMEAVKVAAGISGVAEDGYRLISNCGEGGGQTVNHLHFHLIGGIRLGEGLI